MYFSELEAICQGTLSAFETERPVESLVTDSRKVVTGEGAVFFAINGSHHDGHDFLSDVYRAGIRQFILERPVPIANFSGSNILLVDDATDALQKIAMHHRSSMSIPVIGVTGSNGKTIVKEWLYQLLSSSFSVVKNPGSYNSQIGVPISVWQMKPHHQLGIFEAGISKPNEMQRLNKIIRPTIGVFTNIGSAHNEGFANSGEKVAEKLKLFEGSDVLIYCKDHQEIASAVEKSKLNGLSWGSKKFSPDILVKHNGHDLTISYKNTTQQITVPFKDEASIENCMHCIAVMLHLGFDANTISQRITLLHSVPMRLELKEGINRCHVIDDTYNNDLAGLRISLQFLANQNQRRCKRLILSDILQSGLSELDLAKQISNLITENRIDSFIGIGPVLSRNSAMFALPSAFFVSTDDFLKEFDFSQLHDEVILIKGARSFAFERVVNRIQQKFHGTVMEINLGAVVHNLNYFKSLLSPRTKVMVMVKAFAYGSGSIEIANLLQYHKVDYLGVAYADEGIELRKNNISLPIMVMNPTEETFQSLMDFNLEPEIYSFKILDAFIHYLDRRPAIIHIKVDTGMHRLGFEREDTHSLIEKLKSHPEIKIASIFSHLAGADEQIHDKFSEEQAEQFKKIADEISAAIGYKPIYHLLNSPGIMRLPQLQFDMVRLGVGLYGVNPTSDNARLKTVATLKTVISQIRTISKGETIGYGRRGKADREIRIATIAIGYADGYTRAFSRGVGKVLVNGKMAPVIGNVCMDMTMIDITGIDASEGDEVVIFGDLLPIENVAESINTIAYEILTNTSERVKRVFVAESI